MSPQQMITPEQKAQVKAQLERVTKALELKRTQIALKRQKASLHREQLAEFDRDESTDTLVSAFENTEVSILENDAALLELDLGEFTAMVEVLMQQVRQLDSGLVVATSVQPRRSGRN